MTKIDTTKMIITPLITPYYDGIFDEQSFAQLIARVEKNTDIMIPCLSTGEGDVLDYDSWCQVVAGACKFSAKPIFAGIKSTTEEEVYKRAAVAKEYSCEGVAVIVFQKDIESAQKYISRLTIDYGLKVIVYATPSYALENTDILKTILEMENVVAIKDSTESNNLLECIRRESKAMPVYLGLETRASQVDNYDGVVFSLSNNEPQFISDWLRKNNSELNQEFAYHVDRLRLASDTWYQNIKEDLYSKHIIRSQELVTYENNY